MSYDTNPYYNPEKHGLTKLGELDLAEPSYSFDLVVAWKGADGIYLGTDSGCSCPTPFEDYAGVQDMTGPLTAAQAVEEVCSLAVKAQGYDWEKGEDVGVYDQVGLDTLIAAIEGAQ